MLWLPLLLLVSLLCVYDFISMSSSAGSPLLVYCRGLCRSCFRMSCLVLPCLICKVIFRIVCLRVFCCMFVLVGVG